MCALSIEKAKIRIKNKLGDDYKLVSKYENVSSVVSLKHVECGFVYRKLASSIFYNDLGKCPICTDHKIGKLNYKEFKHLIKIITNGRYKPLSPYKKSHKKFRVLHKECNREWEITPNNFINRGRRCPSCHYDKQKNLARQGKLAINKTKTNDQFLKEFKEVSNGEFDVVEGEEYKGAHTKLKIRHNVCGQTFLSTPNNFLRNRSCMNCVTNTRKTIDQFIKEVEDITDGEYEVLGQYESAKTKIKVRHKECGNEYFVLPDNILRGRRCPCIKISKGEAKIKKWLRKQGINFKSEKMFKDFKSPKGGYMRFDFYIPNKNLVIEYQGIQHYKYNDYFYTDKEEFKYRKELDNLKREYCENNNIKLIEISYKNLKNIEEILKKVVIKRE